MFKKLLDVLSEVIKESVEEDVKKCDPSVQKLYESSKEFISRNLADLSDNDLDTALAISKSLTETIKYAWHKKKEKEEKTKEDK